MSTPPPEEGSPGAHALSQRLAALGREIGSREALHAQPLETARELAARLRSVVAQGLEAFHAAAAESGARHMVVELSEPHTDDKHLRSVEFDLQRGRHRAIVTTKSRGEVTLVGPFRQGKDEGPCQRIPFDAGDELDEGLAGFLERFLEEAATP
jgi:hypothetical protein